MIEFYNIKSGERVKLTRPHQIGAYLNSSDLHINSALGQDFGWRLAPSIIVKLDELRADVAELQAISKRIGVDVAELTTVHLVQHLSYLDDLGVKLAARDADRNPAYQSAYEQEVAELKAAKAKQSEEWDKQPAKTAEPKKEAPAKKAAAKKAPEQLDVEVEAKKAAESNAPATEDK